MHTVLDVQSLRPHGGGHHRDTVGEGLEDLHPGPTAVAERHDGDRCPSQLVLHGRDLAHHGHHPGPVEPLDAGARPADQSYLRRRNGGPDAGSDGGRQPLRPVDVGGVAEAPLEQHDRRPAGRRVPRRLARPRVRVGDHLDVGQSGPGRVHVARDHHPLHLGGQRPLESSPVSAVEPGLVPGQAGPHGSVRGARSQLVGQQIGPEPGLDVLEVHQIHDGRAEVGPSRPFEDGRSREPHHVVGRTGPFPKGQSRGTVGSEHGHLQRDAPADRPFQPPSDLPGHARVRRARPPEHREPPAAPRCSNGADRGGRTGRGRPPMPLPPRPGPGG